MGKQKQVKRVVYHKNAKEASIHLMASGLSNDEIKKLEELIRKWKEKEAMKTIHSFFMI